MDTHNSRALGGITLALAVTLPCMAVSLNTYAAPDGEEKNSVDRKSARTVKEQTIEVVAPVDEVSPTSVLKAPTGVGALGSIRELDTPFSIRTLTEKDIQDKQVTTTRELFADDASVTTTSSAYSSYGSQFSIRGISTDWASFINGLPITAVSQELSPEMFERVDVLKGATGFMYGFGMPGGAINYVTKRPTNDAILNVTTGYRSNSVFTQSMDIGGRGGPDDRFGLRLNMVNEQGNLPVRDAQINRKTVGLGLDARVTSAVTLYGDLIYGRRHIKNPSASSFNITELAKTGQGTPSTVRLNHLKTRIGDGDIDDRSLYSQAGISWQLSDSWRLKTDYVYQKNNERFTSPLPYLTGQNGDYVMRAYDTKVFNINHVLQALLEGKVDTGPVQHNINTGVTLRRYKSARSPDAFFGNIGSGNIFEPTVINYHSRSMSDPSRYDKRIERALFISDRMVLNDYWALLAGVRHTDYTQKSATRPKDYDKSVNTPTLALVFSPEANTSIYTSYVEALEEGGTVAQQYKNANEMLSPLKSKQYEVGIKTDQTRWSGTAALFRIKRGAAYANADNVWVQDGEERYQGLELTGKVIVSRNIDFSASAMLLDPTYRNVAPGKDIEGKRVAGVPRFQSAAEIGWIPDSLPDLRTSLRWRHQGGTSPDEQGRIHVSSHDLFDLYVNYDTEALGRPVTARFGVTNLMNKKYWTSGTNNLYVGDPRTVMANVSIRF